MNDFQKEYVERAKAHCKDVSKSFEIDNSVIIIVDIRKRSSLLAEGVCAIIIKDSNEVIYVVQYSELTFYKDGWEYKGEINENIKLALKKAIQNRYGK